MAVLKTQSASNRGVQLGFSDSQDIAITTDKAVWEDFTSSSFKDAVTSNGSSVTRTNSSISSGDATFTLYKVEQRHQVWNLLKTVL